VEDTTPVLAESTAGIQLAGEAEKAITAKPEALVPPGHIMGQSAGTRSRHCRKRVGSGSSRAFVKSHAQVKRSPSSM
jgi:hypothetical protein